MRLRKTDVIRSVDPKSGNPIGSYFSISSTESQMVYAYKIREGKAIDDNQYLFRKRLITICPTEKIKASNSTLNQIEQNLNTVKIRMSSREGQRIVQSFNVNKQMLYRFYTNNNHVYITFSDILYMNENKIPRIILLNVRRLS